MLARPPAFKALIAGGGLSAALAAVAVTAAGGTPVFILKRPSHPPFGCPSSSSVQPPLLPRMSRSLTGPIALWPPTLAALGFLDVPLPPLISDTAANSSGSGSNSGGGVYDHTGSQIFPWQTAPFICDGPALYSCIMSRVHPDAIFVEAAPIVGHRDLEAELEIEAGAPPKDGPAAGAALLMSDGSSKVGDCIIACDGIFSPVRSDLIRLSSAASPPPDPDAPSKEPKFSLMHEYTWMLTPPSPSAASLSGAAAGVFEFWGPAASPHRLSIVYAADGSARVRACISAISLSTTPAARDVLALKDAVAAPPPPHASAALSSINGSHAISRELSAADTAAAADVLDAAFSSFCPEVKSIISTARGTENGDGPRLYVQALSHLPLQPLYGGGCTSLFGDAAEGQGGVVPGVELLNYSQAAVCLASQLSRVMPNVRGSMAAGLRSFEQNREVRLQEVSGACSRWRRLALPMSSIMQHISHAKLRLAAKGVGPQPDRFLHSYDALEIFSIFKDD